MYKKLKSKLNEYIFSKELIEKILVKRINHLIYSTDRKKNNIDICIRKIIDDLKKLLL